MPVEPKQAGGPARPPEKAGRPAKPCPICGKPAERAFRPFCSPRCRDVDLNRWLSGRYVIPARDDEEDGEISQFSQ
jgi:uncharacterized protein